ncbi:hypothetical protein [Azohydromonas sediminis]|uniref:hypothetical protein n=1 Tax=Azohydromonas sediminis TaxID=2259674 RepID=UPI000E654F29|nr:hypothetical protein [Azohydromonas sediminis]
MYSLAELEPLLRRVVREELQRAMCRGSLTPAQRMVFDAVAQMFAPGETFTAGDAISAARFDPDARQSLQQAVDCDAQRLGIVLGQLADAGAQISDMRLVRLPKEAGARRWMFEALEGAESL